MKTLKSYIMVAFVAALLIACDDNNESIESEGTHVSAVLKLQHSLGLGDEFVLTDSDDEDKTLELSKFKYIVSDIVITNTDDEAIALDNNDAAQLIDLENADATNQVFAYLTGIPEGSYKSISFGIGVSQEVADGSTEDQIKLMELAESDMQWTWNPNSYIFSKIEASDINSVETVSNNLQIHVGNKGDFNGYRTVSLTFPETLTLSSSVSPSVHFTVAIEELFNPEAPGISVAYDAIGAHGDSSDISVNFADNYANIFEIHHIHPTEEAINLEDVEEENHSDDDSSEHTH
ncbi:hypothetical protein Q4595_10435 [Wenyingzhuangia sp. 1_MG-2023]|nr:hypothetical protein [Wenyingzhuangia sp. 1_MG-2023]